MPIFRLEGDRLIIAEETDLELETHLETWLENSPQVLAQESFLWIGRQPSAADEEGTIFPDLLGVDTEGNLVIVELKRGQSPREVIAQLLEYAAWADGLLESQIREIAGIYFENRDELQEKTFNEVFREAFEIPETDELPPLNRRLRLFIAAEEISSRIARVCRFLRISQGMDISCIAVSTFETEAGERLVSTEVKVGDEDIATSKTQRQRTSGNSRLLGDKPLDMVIWETVQVLMQGNKEYFTLKEVRGLISKKYSDFVPSRVDYQVYSDCVNFSKRSDYPGGSDRYWWIERGKYCLYDPEKDKLQEDDD